MADVVIMQIASWERQLNVTSSSSSFASRVVDTNRRPCGFPFAGEGSIASRLVSPNHRGLQGLGLAYRGHCWCVSFYLSSFLLINWLFALTLDALKHTRCVYNSVSPPPCDHSSVFASVRLQQFNFRRTWWPSGSI